MNTPKSREIGERRRHLMAYYKIALGMTIKECAGIMGIGEKLADWYWVMVKKRIRSAQHKN